MKERDCTKALVLEIQYTAEGEPQQFIRDSLRSHNLRVAPTDQEPSALPVSLILRDEKKQVVGGLLGMLYRHCFALDILWVDDAHRGTGCGARLMTAAEAVVREKGCRMIHLDTFSFQAPAFYQRQGYEVFGVLDGYPDGIRRYYLRKMLVSEQKG